MSIPSNLSNKLITTNALWNILTEVTNNIYDNMPEPVDISGKADKINPVFDGSMTLNYFRTPKNGVYHVSIGEYAVAFNNNSQAMGQVAAAAGIGSHAEGCGDVSTSINLGNIGIVSRDTMGDITSIQNVNYPNLQTGDVIVGATNAVTITKSGNYISLEPYLKPSSRVTIIQGSTAIGDGSHAEGYKTKAFGNYSHTEGKATIASGDSSHVVGTFNIKDDYSNRPMWYMNRAYKAGDKVRYGNTDNGYTCIIDDSSGIEPSRNSNWTKDTKINYIEIVGNGTAEDARSNARTLDWDGNEWLAGNITINGGSLTLHDQDGDVTITAAQLRSLLATLQ